MGFSDSQYRDKRKNTDRADRRAPQSTPEGMIEDEEDYEEFVRSMEKKRGRSGSSGAERSRSSRVSSADGRRQRPEYGRGPENNGYRPAGDLNSSDSRYTGSGSRGKASSGGRSAGAGEMRRKGAAGPGSADRDGIRINGSAGSSAGSGTSSGKSGGKRKKRGILKFFIILFVILLLIAGAVGGYFYHKMQNVLALQQVNSIDLEEQLRQGIPYKVRSDEYMNGYRNIALFGVDSRSGDLLGGDNRSDTMMICSVHEKTGEIRLVSVYRDTLLDVGDGDYRKANTAYALGGPAQAIDMLNKNLDLNIVDFVTVGFEGLAHTIDAFGGIELEIDEEERGYLNQYLHDMHIELGTDETPVEKTGLVTVTGIQATAYSRIRYTAGDDFRRTERQRTVLSKTLEKAKAASPTTLVKVADYVMGDVATSLSSSEILSLIMMAGKAELADTGGLPQEEYRAFRTNYEEGDYVLPKNLSDNVKWLHGFLFNDSEYTLSEEAAQRDAAILDYGTNNSWDPGY